MPMIAFGRHSLIGPFRVREWLRDSAICVLLDLLSWVVPRDQRFEVIIEPEDQDTMVAVLREAPTLRNSEQTKVAT